MVLRILILIFALGAAGGAAWLSTSMGAREPVVAATTAPEEIPTRDVLVAVGPISPGEVLSPAKIGWKPWPVTTLNDQYILSDEQPEAIQELSGSFVNRAFAAGEPIRAERLMETNINLLSNKIAKGMRAAAVRVSAENTAGGFILPGDRVDVIHTVTTQSAPGQQARNEAKIIIANARVLAIDQTSVQNPEGSTVGKTATLELTPEDAERIMAAEASGLLSLALRPLSDHLDTTRPDLVEIRTVRIHRAAITSTVTLR